MASATQISTVETPSHQSLSHTAAQWVDIIQRQLALVSPYEDSQEEFLPSSIVMDEAIMDAPRRRTANPEAAALANQIAQLLYPDMENSIGAIIAYEKDIVKLRRLVIKQRKRAIHEATERKELMNWDKRIVKQGPWDPNSDPVSLNGAPSLPMPVKIAEPETLEPFFEHLALDGSVEKSSTERAAVEATEIEEPYYNIKSLEFEKGVVYSDHRMDLCKMVVGPTNIGNLMNSLKTNTFITHFLLGNNIIGPHGAKCIADFVKEHPNRMDTWYLAGNCIDTGSFKLLVDEWVTSTSVTNIWLKRNPLMSTAAHDLFRLITQTPNLRTLDLDQTELGDAGVAELFTKLASHVPENPLPLRHIYLNAVGIGEKASAAIAEFLATPHCMLDALYASSNPMGNHGTIALAAGLKKNESLTRLALASIGLSDDGAIALCEALTNHPKISTLDLGQHFATQDLGSRYNWLTDHTAPSLLSLLHTTPLTYLNLGAQPLTHTALNTLLLAIPGSTILLYFSAKTIFPQSRTASAIKAGQEHVRLLKAANAHLAANVQRVYDGMSYGEFLAEEKRWVVSDRKDVRKIDSVYRNRDAGLARKGVGRLEKLWGKGDVALEGVMGGVVR